MSPRPAFALRRPTLTIPASALAALLAVLSGAAPLVAQNDLPPAPAFYLAPDIATGGAGVAVGPDGTVHVVATEQAAGANQIVLYATCRAECTSAAAWRRVAIPLPGATRAEVAVTPRGAPRLLITAAADDGGRDFFYAECGALRGGFAPRGVPEACYDPAGWSIAKVASNNDSALSNFTELTLPQRSFALDPAGNPRFIFNDADYFIEPDHYGAFYLSCDRDCLNPRNWTETNLANQFGSRFEQFTRPVLAIGPTGSAHVLAWVYAFDAAGRELPSDLYYYECLSDCTRRGNWRRVSVINPGSGSYPSPTWDLAIDPSGRPRAAVFIGGLPTQAGLDYSLVYFWCNERCTSDSGWAGQVVFGDGHGESPALALDAAGRPRIAFLSSDALPVVAACNVLCETMEGAWNGFAFEAETDMLADRPTAIPFTCDGELWSTLVPDIAVAPGGALFVAYDVAVRARCLYREVGDPVTTFEFHDIWRGVRLAEPRLP